MQPDVHIIRINVFLPYRGQFHFHMPIEKLFARLALPNIDTSSLHPALLNAIFLAACFTIGGPEMEPLETFFLMQTRLGLQVRPSQIFAAPIHTSD